ncbi:hypothetical protein MNEG_7374, partial [Monoraphidium neglectum]
MLRAVAHAIAWLVAAWHAHVVVPLVNAWESVSAQAEASLTAVIREWFGIINRLLNAAGAWVLSVVDASYAETQLVAGRQQQAWQRWWREDRTSTLNAVVANAHSVR